MSQHWHGHWTNDAFKPVRLKNWEVPNWHPCWPDRHCKTTQFMADNNGRILVGQKRSPQSPWGYFKGTWELPTKISRKEATELSAPPRYKLNAWALHKKINKAVCEMNDSKLSVKKEKDHSPVTKNVLQDKVSKKSDPEISSHTPRIADTTPKTPCPIHNTCQI